MYIDEKELSCDTRALSLFSRHLLHNNINDEPCLSLSKSKVVSPKFMILIRDVPNFDYLPIFHILLTSLHDRNIFPNFCYSVRELLKIPKNIIKMKDYGTRRQTCTTTAIANGCNLLMKDLLDNAMRSEPELLIVDYMSETLVDARRIADTAIQQQYKVYFLKRKSGQSTDEDIQTVVNKICLKLNNNQDLTKIRRAQEMDKWWNESIGIVVKHIRPVPYSHIEKFSLNKFNFPFEYMVDHRTRGTKHITGDVNTIQIFDHSPLETLCFINQTNSYCNKMNDMSLYCDSYKKYTKYMKNIREDELMKQKWRWANHSCTLVIIKDEPLKKTRRLIDKFVECLVETGITVHVIPVGEIAINPRCAQLVNEYKTKLGWNIIETFKTVVPDIFYQLYDQEDVVVLDCIHESLVGIERFINDAFRNNWKVYTLSQNSSRSEQEIIQNMLHIVQTGTGHSR